MNDELSDVCLPPTGDDLNPPQFKLISSCLVAFSDLLRFYEGRDSKVERKERREEIREGGEREERGKVSSDVVICSFIYASSCLCCSKSLTRGQITRLLTET